MHPVLVKFGNFVISSWGVMVAIAFILSYWLSSLEFKRKRMDYRLLENIFIAAFLGGIAGAKILFVFENFTLGEIIKSHMSLFLSRGGFTFYGGFILAVLLVWLITKRNSVSFWKVSDALAPAIAIGHSIGRIGCFLVGDDYGTPTNLPWGISFPKGSPPTLLRVHPTQLYETIILGIVFIFLWKIRKWKRPDGWLFSIFLIFAGTERFFIEFIRNTTPSPIPQLSLAQLMALIIILIGAAKFIQVRNSVVDNI